MHHSFDISLAKEHGIEEAILIHHFQHWIALNKRMGKNLIEGRSWTYQTQKSIVAHFPYFKNRRKIIRLVDSLVEKGILIKGNFNKKKFDRTVWYAFADEKKYIAGVEEDPELFEDDEEDEGLTESAQSSVRKCTMDSAEVHTPLSESAPPIPDTKTNTKPYEKENIKRKKPEKIEKVAYREHVFLTEEEHRKISEEYGGWTARALDVLEAHKASSGKKYASDYAVFKSGGWLHDKFLAERSPIEAVPQARTFSQAEKIEWLVNDFVKKNWSSFQAQHLTPFVEGSSLKFESRKNVKFGEKVFDKSFSEENFVKDFNAFMKEREVNLKFEVK